MNFTKSNSTSDNVVANEHKRVEGQKNKTTMPSAIRRSGKISKWDSKIVAKRRILLGLRFVKI